MKVKVTSLPEKFRRAGMEFTREPKVVEVNKKTYEILKDEPMLKVEEVNEKKSNAGEDPKQKGK